MNVTHQRLSLPRVAGIGVGVVLLLAAGCASPPAAGRRGHDAAPPAVSSAPVAAGVASNGVSAEMAADLEAQWGIRVESLRLSAHGHIIDFRYRVLDPGKAAVLADGSRPAFLINERTGERLKVPNMPKVGALRSTAARLERNRIYLVLFANPGSRVTAGQPVTVEIGDFKAEHLAVE